MIIRHSTVNRSVKANELRDARIAAGYSRNGVVFQIDTASRSAIANRAIRVYRGSDEVNWRTMSNDNCQFTAEDFLAFSDEVDAYVETIMQECWSLKQTSGSNNA